MQLNFNGNKSFRLLSIYERLSKGELLEKSSLALQYNVTQKTIQRDIDDLRVYLAEVHFFDDETSIKYDKTKNGYFLVKFEREWLLNEEVLAICKILLESRALQKDEMQQILDKLIVQSVPSAHKLIKDLIRNEFFCYVPLQHKKQLLKPIWILSEYISNNEIISFSYKRIDKTIRQHSVKPVALMFSEFYFYLIAYMADDTKEYPTIFRIDRIDGVHGTGKKFTIPYRNKFSDGEFRKRIQFMYSGKLNKVTFEYSGSSIESVLDRLPTAEILRIENGLYVVRTEVYGNGINMWLKSQGDKVKVLGGEQHEQI